MAKPKVDLDDIKRNIVWVSGAEKSTICITVRAKPHVL